MAEPQNVPSSLSPSSLLPAPQAREAERAPRRVDVAVVGGGVVGVACALELARRGVSVALLERDRVGYGCSYGNAGWLTPSLALPLPAPGLLFKATKWLFDPESPLYIQPRLDPFVLRWLVEFVASMRRAKFERGARAMIELSRASVDAWRELAARTPGGFGFEGRGLVTVYESPGAFAEARRNVELVARHGVRFETWTAEEVAAREPAVVGRQIGAYYFPDDAHCEPYLAVQALAAEAVGAGVRMVEGAELFSAERHDGAIGRLRTAKGDVEAEHVVLALGAWSAPLGRALDLRLPILGGKGYSLVLPPLEPHPTRSIYLAERKIAVNPHARSLRIAGTLELVRDDLSVNRRRVDAIVRGAEAMLRLPQPLEVREVWRGLRPCTPDGLPMIGRAKGLRNVWLATGHQMTGLKTAPATGQLLAELLTGATPSFDPAPFRADRF